MEELSKSIWQLTEDVLELLRSQSRRAIYRQKKTSIPWLDELTETQGNTVIAVRKLCEDSPDGVTLKRLAETMGVTPAAASVMVDLLVKKKALKRTKSKADRRAVLIRLTPDMSDLFDISDQNLLQSFASLREILGPEVLLDWQRILITATAAMRRALAERHPEDSEEDESPEGEESADGSMEAQGIEAKE
jgi:DNA-binding MarR family transcriptional regulator